MDVRATGNKASIPSRSKFGETATTLTTVQLSLLWFACFAIADPMDGIWFLAAAAMALANIFVVLRMNAFRRFSNGAVSGVHAHRLGVVGCVGCTPLPLNHRALP